MALNFESPGDIAPAGSIAFARPKSTLHRAIRSNLDVRGRQIAVNDPLLTRRFQRLGDLLRDRQRFIEGDGSTNDSLQ